MDHLSMATAMRRLITTKECKTEQCVAFVSDGEVGLLNGWQGGFPPIAAAPHRGCEDHAKSLLKDSVQERWPRTLGHKDNVGNLIARIFGKSRPVDETGYNRMRRTGLIDNVAAQIPLVWEERLIPDLMAWVTGPEFVHGLGGEAAGEDAESDPAADCTAFIDWFREKWIEKLQRSFSLECRLPSLSDGRPVPVKGTTNSLEGL